MHKRMLLSMKRIIELTLTVLAVLGLSGSSAQKQSLEGVWRSEGYGLVFEVQGTRLKSFEVTATTCMPGDAAQREETSIDGSEVTFKTTDEDTVALLRRLAEHYDDATIAVILARHSEPPLKGLGSPRHA